MAPAYPNFPADSRIGLASIPPVFILHWTARNIIYITSYNSNIYLLKLSSKMNFPENGLDLLEFLFPLGPILVTLGTFVEYYLLSTSSPTSPPKPSIDYDI